MMRWLVVATLVTPLLIGSRSPCPEPNTPNIEDCPFTVDPDIVVGKLLDCVRLEVGQQFMQTRTWCDPEGDPATVEILAAPEGVQIINRPKTSSYTLLWTPRQIMTAAIVVQVTDQPAHGQPKSSIGTIVIHVVPHKQRSVSKGCGSLSR